MKLLSKSDKSSLIWCAVLHLNALSVASLSLDHLKQHVIENSNHNILVNSQALPLGQAALNDQAQLVMYATHHKRDVEQDSEDSKDFEESENLEGLEDSEDASESSNLKIENKGESDEDVSETDLDFEEYHENESEETESTQEQEPGLAETVQNPLHSVAVTAAHKTFEVPVKGPVKHDQLYDKEERPLVYEVDVDEVERLIDKYLGMGKEKMCAFFATASTGHFKAAVKGLVAEVKSNKSEADLKKLKKLVEDTDEYLNSETNADDRLLDALKGGTKLADYKQFEKQNDPYCALHEYDCEKEASEISKDLTKPGATDFYMTKVQARANILKSILEDENLDEDAALDSQEFKYREGNIFLDEDQNDKGGDNKGDCSGATLNNIPVNTSLLVIASLVLLLF